MNKKDITEIKRRLKNREDCTITRMCGCYVDSGKNKIVSFNPSFLTLEDEEFHKYLEIAGKVLSGTPGNNLLELEFPTDEELGGKAYPLLMKLRETGLSDDETLQKFYDLVIESYDYLNNYLILLFKDAYDIPMKGTDNLMLDDSEEVYDYILCAICPVNLSKPGLSYKENENTIGARERDWVVGAVDTGFTFPAFTDRSTDLHHVLVYTKNTKEPHKEFWENGLGCPSRYTSTEKRIAFTNMVLDAAGGQPEEAEDQLLDVQEALSNRIIDYLEKGNSDSPMIMDKNDVHELLEQSGMSDDASEKIETRYEEAFASERPEATELLDPKLLKSGEDRAEKKELKKEVVRLTDQLKEAGILTEDGEEADLVVRVRPDKIDEINTTYVDGVRCLLIPMDDIGETMINGEPFFD